MSFSQWASIFGCTTAAFISIAPLQAEAAKYQIQSGATSVYHDLSFLSNIGLNLTGSNNTVTPINSDFIVGFGISPTTNFTFSDVGGFSQLSGTIQHTGTVTFNKEITIGNFSVGYDPTRAINNASGLFLKDTVSLNKILFDLSAPGNMEFDGKNLTIADVKLLFTSDFASILGDSSLLGQVGGTARIDAKVVEVPESTSAIAFLVAAVPLLRSKLRKQM
jgi:hypothetical protein